MKYTLNTDFALLNDSQAYNWRLNFRNMVREAFDGVDNDNILLANLLILESYINTYRHGLEENGEEINEVIEIAQNFLWDCLNGKIQPKEFEDFANNLDACVMQYNVGEELTDSQEEFYEKYFSDSENGNQMFISEWQSLLLMELTVISGGRYDFENWESVEDLNDWYCLESMLDFLTDACVDFAQITRISYKASDIDKAEAQLYKTQLYRNLVAFILNTLKVGMSGKADMYEQLREEYSQTMIIPEEFAAELLEY